MAGPKIATAIMRGKDGVTDPLTVIKPPANKIWHILDLQAYSVGRYANPRREFTYVGVYLVYNVDNTVPFNTAYETPYSSTNDHNNPTSLTASGTAPSYVTQNNIYNNDGAIATRMWQWVPTHNAVPSGGGRVGAIAQVDYRASAENWKHQVLANNLMFPTYNAPLGAGSDTYPNNTLSPPIINNDEIWLVMTGRFIAHNGSASNQAVAHWDTGGGRGHIKLFLTVNEYDEES